MALSKQEKEAGYKAIQQPNEQHVAVLRRVAAGHLNVTRGFRNDKPFIEFTYDDGSLMSHLGKPGRDQEKAVNHMVTMGWLIPIKNEDLPLGDGIETPQRYRARTVEDGLLPRWIEPPR